LRHGRRALVLRAVATIIIAVPTSAAFAQSQCLHHGGSYTIGLARYKVSRAFTTHIPSIGSTKARYASILAGDAWNEEANARRYRYVGLTSRVTIPEFRDGPDGCTALGIDYSLIVAVDEPNPSNGLALTIPRCRYGSRAAQFLVKVFKRDENGDPIQWSVGETGPDDIDLPSVLAHELGHTQNIGHPEAGVAATMAAGYVIGTNRIRDLYRWDIVCASVFAGFRGLSAHQRLHLAGSELQPEVHFLGDWTVSKGSAGLYIPALDYAATFLRTDTDSKQTQWTMAFNQDDTIGLLDPMSDSVGIGPRESVWREDESTNRVLYSTNTGFPLEAETESHWLRMTESDDGFWTQAYGDVEVCQSMQPGFGCDLMTTGSVWTGKAVSTAWDNWNDRTVIAWVNQDRLSAPTSRSLQVSVGTVVDGDDVLAEPEDLGVQVTTTPGLACNAFSAGNFDCIIAYVRHDDPYSYVKVRRFWARAVFWDDPFRYVLQHDEDIGGVPYEYPVTSAARTTSAIAAWYKDGLFYLAIRKAATNQRLSMYESADGANWSYVNSYGYTDVGPTSIGYYQGDTNAVVYFE